MRMTDYNKIWEDLENNNVIGDAGNLSYKEATVISHYTIFCSLERDTRRRGIIIRFPDSGKKYQQPQSSRGFHVHITTHLTHNTGFFDIIISISGNEYNDIFTTFSNNLLYCLTKLETRDDIIEYTLRHLRKWQNFMEKLTATSLNPNQCRGLYGELYFMYTRLFPLLGTMASVSAWYGPEKKQQDFLLDNSTGVEVKTTAGKMSDSLTISSEQQLDPSGFSALYLYHLEIVELRDNTKTLNNLVDLILSCCDDNPDALMEFSRKLAMCNYRQKDREHYDSTGYSIRKESVYHVSNGFPNITGTDLKSGISSVKYLLSTSALEQYVVGIPELLKSLKEGYD